MPGCKSNLPHNVEKKSTVPTFGFPKNVLSREAWLRFILRQKWTSGFSAAVCINRFTSDDIINQLHRGIDAKLYQGYQY